MLILRTLSLHDLHGYGIAQFIRHSSDNELLVEEASVHPALQHLVCFQKTSNKVSAVIPTIAGSGISVEGSPEATTTPLLLIPAAYDVTNPSPFGWVICVNPANIDETKSRPMW